MTNLPDGDFKAEITLSGGTGRTTVQSPANVHIENSVITAEIVWSSPNYDLMIVSGKQYTPTSMEGGSRFTVEIPSLDTPLDIQAETIAMSTPHMIDYTITVSSKEILTGDNGESSVEGQSSLDNTSAESGESSVGEQSSAEDSSADLSRLIESLNSLANASGTGSAVTVFSTTVESPNKTSDFPPIAIVAISAVLGAVVAFTAITIGKKKK